MLINCNQLKLLFVVPGLDDAVKLVKGIGGQCHGYVVDLTSREDIYRVAKKVHEEVGRVCYPFTLFVMPKATQTFTVMGLL